MAARPVEIAIALHGRDGVVGPFTMLQAVAIAAGVAVGMGLFTLDRIPAVPRGLLSLAVPLVVLLSVCARPRGHTLPHWGLLLVEHLVARRRAVWAPERTVDTPAEAPDQALPRLLERLGGLPTPGDLAPKGPEPERGETPVPPPPNPARAGRRASTQVLTLIPDAIHDRMLTMCTGHRCGLIEVVGPNLERLCDEEREAWNTRAQRFLGGLTHPIKIITRVRPAEIDTYLAAREARARLITERTLRSIELHDIAYMRELATRGGGTGATSCRTFVAVPAPDAVDDTVRPGFWRTVRGAPPPRRRPDAVEAATALDARCQSIIAELARLGVQGWRLDEQHLGGVVHGATRPRSASLQPFADGALADAQMPLAVLTPASRRGPALRLVP